VARAVQADLRDGVLARFALPRITLASIVVAAGHTCTFLLAAWTIGSGGSVVRLLPIAVVVLLAMTIPLSVGGWGPREGVAAWAFAAFGLGAGQGVAAATAYGVLALFSVLPGMVVLLMNRFRSARRFGTREAQRSAATVTPPAGLEPVTPGV
jgi:uncharacterized membrane protein YbhN (UPF0104 family)